MTVLFDARPSSQHNIASAGNSRSFTRTACKNGLAPLLIIGAMLAEAASRWNFCACKLASVHVHQCCGEPVSVDSSCCSWCPLLFLLLVAGLIILNAHNVTETSGEGFAVRLYRQGTNIGSGSSRGGGTAAALSRHHGLGNPTGFLRAFSDNAAAFSSGFNRTEKIMRVLRVRLLLLFPRFHQSVQDSLEGHPAQVGGWWW